MLTCLPTGKGNDQVRQSKFQPPFAGSRQRPGNPILMLLQCLTATASQAEPLSSTTPLKKASPLLQQNPNLGQDEHLADCSYESGILEAPEITPPEDMWKLTIDPMKAPDKPEDFTLEFTKGYRRS